MRQNNSYYIWSLTKYVCIMIWINKLQLLYYKMRHESNISNSFTIWHIKMYFVVKCIIYEITVCIIFKEHWMLIVVKNVYVYYIYLIIIYDTVYKYILQINYVCPLVTKIVPHCELCNVVYMSFVDQLTLYSNYWPFDKFLKLFTNIFKRSFLEVYKIDIQYFLLKNYVCHIVMLYFQEKCLRFCNHL